jgi:hypothetical protein
MDRHDVTDLPQHFENLKRQKQMLQDAQSRKGQRPAVRPRMETIFQFTMRAMANDTRAISSSTASSMQYVASSFVPSSYPPCVAPFSELTKTFLRDLVLETHHRGKYLLVRCATRQDRMTAIMAIVEDESSDVVLLQLYHQEQADDPVEISSKRAWYWWSRSLISRSHPTGALAFALTMRPTLSSLRLTTLGFQRCGRAHQF